MLINPDLRKVVCFIGVMGNGRFQPRATAFAVQINVDGYHFRYIVTAEHNIQAAMRAGQQLYARINMQDGTAREVPLEIDGWLYHPDNARDATDVAVGLFWAKDEDDLLAVGLNGDQVAIADQDTIMRDCLGLGDETVTIGLFRYHGGRHRNLPVVRIGNLAALNEESLRGGGGREIKAHLIEARSIGGLSGSPVFLHLPAWRVVDRRAEATKTGRQFYLLGLIHGHYGPDESAETRFLDEQAKTVGVHTGISMVVPVEKIVETIMQPSAAAVRQICITEARSAGRLPEN